ncbi:hypothetical protein N7517_010615 [Penicillium concentricum]|uniref:Uncharacterized protein n=1 Tax=Penicillium concentricum TaxID=293559 RepID=A0A9W9UV92_9EURO|nr:uncharacterized protein N7517_010615 [Penicillium concentricum]KAJ5356006.1 hypothetical protein N7517_010615 [Penicillium concentricum]
MLPLSPCSVQMRLLPFDFCFFLLFFWNLGATSLSVSTRKAAGRVVLGFILFLQGFGNVSVCDRAEGSRACGGSIGWRRGWLVGVAAVDFTEQTSLSVRTRRAAERLIHCLNPCEDSMVEPQGLPTLCAEML